MRKKTRSPKDHISDRKEACDSKWNRNGRSVSVHDTLYYLDCWSFRLWQDLFHRIFTLGSFGRIARKLSPYDSLLLRGVARWISRRERRWCSILLRDSYHLPSAQMVSERWFTHVIWSDSRGRWRHRVAGLIHQTFITSSKYHLAVLVQEHFPPGNTKKSISRNAHYILAFKNPRDQLRMRNLLPQTFPTCWQDMMDVYISKSDRTTIRVHGPGFTSCQW